jgi:broad specificity phosphatase PhoE
MEDRPLNTRVILVRHGESTYNVLRKIQGQCDDSVLTDLGQTGARQVGQALQGIPIDAAYSSPLQRAHQTASLILDTLRHHQPIPDLQRRDTLQEINLVNWEGLTFTEVEQHYPDQARLWHQAPHQLTMELDGPDGPKTIYPLLDLFDQATQFWKETLPHHAGQTILVVAHSGINRVLIATALGLQPEQYIRLYQSNCGINVLNFPSGWGEPAQLESMNLTTHLGKPVPAIRSGQGGFRMLLVRHGETDWNRDKRFQGQIDVPLNATGDRQAADAADYLKEVPITRAISSPLLRPKQTAEAILRHHPQVTLELMEGLKEISHGLWEGKLESEIEVDYAAELQSWKVAPETVQMPDGETLQDVWTRSAAAWDAIARSMPVAQPGDPLPTVMVVAHDAVNKAILCDLMQLGPDQFWRFKQGNGAVSVIDYPNGADGVPVLRAMNITTGGSVLDKTAAGAL